MRRPFMKNPGQLESLEGQQYLVLRPTSGVADRYVREQNDALAVARLPHPYTGHVTLRGFYEPARREELAALIRSWASEQQPIEIMGEAIDAFPEPWQILILRLARTRSLVSAYATLTELLDATDFRRLGELPLDDWTFHMSIVYGKTLSGEAWAAIESERVQKFEHPIQETVFEAELVSYSDGTEHSEIILLGR
ncbi:2'-5' RNA ligase family protein [Microbacterium sp. 3J1]|uniref:2'-5' RNA ligase family protein n=1 Tax=Microbacterium sp. 3J1 TaxID=861269 RepID=UPI000AF2715A|nr:2'-5' RNA ligase family protein [Microbacterium sp. 3J1]